jgi:hypothetical protein
MELIAYIIQNYRVEEDEIKNSTFTLVVNQEGEETISFNHEQLTLHNCSIRNIISESKVWEKYFNIYHDQEEGGIVVRAQKYQTVRLTKVRE